MSAIEVERLVDLHVHFGPDFSRPGHEQAASVTAAEAVREAAQAGYAALVLKSHDFGSQSLALALEETVGGVRVFGGVALDYAVGGLNPIAVEQTLRLGGKIVWLPTVASMQDLAMGASRRLGFHRTGVPVIDDAGEVLPVVHEIFELVAQYEAILATGHTTAAEHYAVTRAFGESGRVLVTHAGEEVVGPNLDVGQCVELADLGATIELSALTAIGHEHLSVKEKRIEDVAAMIDSIGAARCVLVSDYGWSDELPHPVAGMQLFLDALATAGVSAGDLELMSSRRPAELLGVS